MTVFLNIALLIVGTAATLSAFGGKTWNEGTDAIEKRITMRGWISLTCLGLALAIGTIKELRTQCEQTAANVAAAKAQTKADLDQLAFRFHLAAANAKLDIASQQLEDLTKSGRVTEHRLDDAKDNLAKTQSELDRQGDVNLVTALANSDQRVSDVQFIIPFTSKGTKGTTFHDVFLPKDLSPACRKDTEVDVALWLQSGGMQFFKYPSSDDKPSHAYFTDSPPKVDALFHATATLDLFGEGSAGNANTMVNVNLMRNLAGQRTTNLHAATFAIHVVDQNESAAHFLYPSLGLSEYPINVIGLTPYENLNIRTDEDSESELQKRKDLSVICDKEVKKYFSEAFEKAYVGITLSQNRSMSIFFRLKALPPMVRLGSWTVPFAVDSKPLIFVNDQFAGLLDVDWPKKSEELKDTNH